MTRRAACALATIALALSGCATERPDVFIAFARDFAGYEDWIRFDRGVDPVPPTHDGLSYIYLDALPDPGAASFPVGTRIVRVEEVSDDPGAWVIHAMVKRGGDYNANGALDWEFFSLAVDPEDPRDPFIVWRGQGPADGDGYRPPEGGDFLSCNHCHASAWSNDSVLSPALDLGVLAAE